MNYNIRPNWDTTLAIAFHLGTIDPSNPINELFYDAVKDSGTVPDTIPGKWIPAATVRNSATGVNYRMSGTTASPAWTVY